MSAALHQIRTVISGLAGGIFRGRRLAEDKTEEEFQFHDCGGNVFYLPYRGKRFFRAVRIFCREHPWLAPSFAWQKDSYAGMGPGFLLMCDLKESKVKESV